MKKILFISFLLSLLFTSIHAAILNCAVSTTTGGAEVCARCITGYVVSGLGAACSAEIDQCYEYTDEKVATCKTCAQNYIRSYTGKLCLPPIPNCIVHLDGDNESAPNKYKRCAQCGLGLVPTVQGKSCVKAVLGCTRYNSNGNCTDIKGCKTYSYSAIESSASTYGGITCSACYEDLTLSATGLYCVPFIKDCIAYENDGSCRTCSSSAPAKSLSTMGRSCFVKDGTCAEMNDLGQCTKCNDPTFVPQYPRSTDCPTYPCTSLCVAPKAGCLVYADAATCSKCNSPTLFLYSGSCYPLIPQCLTYETDGTCLTCLSLYSLDKATKATACLKTVANCATYNPQTGICLTCITNYKIAITEITGTTAAPVSKTAACVATDANCATYGLTPTKTAGCVQCNPLYVVYSGVCYLQVPNCVTYTTGCSECATGFTGAASDGALTTPFVKCYPTIASCSAYNSISGLCTACTIGQLSGSGRICLTAIANCATFDELTSTCAVCSSGNMLTKSRGACATALTGDGATCVFLDDTTTTKCAQCPDGFVLNTLRTTCNTADPALTNPSDPIASLYKPGQIIWSTGVGTGKATYCLTHALGTVITTVAPAVTAINFGTVSKEVTFKSCDEVDYRNTLWLVLKDNGTPFVIGTDSASASSSVTPDVSFAAYYPAGSANNGAFPTTISDASYTKLLLRLNAPSVTSIAIDATSYATWNIKLNRLSTTILTGQDIFNNQISIQLKGTRTVTLDADATAGTIAATDTPAGTLNYLAFNTLTPTSPAKTWKLSSTTPPVSGTDGWFDFRQVNLDSSTSAPFDLPNQVAMSSTLVDDSITFRWTIAAVISTLNNVFPAVQGDTVVNANDRTALSSVCNFKFNYNVPNSGWSKGYGAVASVFDATYGEASTPAGHVEISFNIPILDLVTKCGFTYTTLTAALANDNALGIGEMKVGESYLKGKVGYFTGPGTNTNGDGLFKAFYLKLGTMKSERSLFLDTPSTYQWYYSGIQTANLKFNTQIRLFANGTELFGFQKIGDTTHPLVIPGSLIQAKIVLESSSLNTLVPADQIDASLDNNVKRYKDLADDYTFTSIVLKLAKTTTEVTTSGTKYAATITTLDTATAKAKMSSTERNTAFFDIDLRKVLAGTYSILVEYTIRPNRFPTGRLLAQTENEFETTETIDIKQVNEKVSAEDFIGFEGHASPFTIEYQPNFGMKTSSLIGLLLVLILGMI